MALYAMHHIQKACASDLKPGFQFSEGWDPRPHLQGTTQQLILSQRRWQARLEHMYQDNKKDSLPEEKAEDKVQSCSNDNQVGQPNKECRKVTCHRTLRCHVRLNECPSAEVWDWSFPRTPKYLFSSLSCSTTFIPTDLTFLLGWGTHPSYYLDQCNHKKLLITCNSSVKHIWQHDKNLHRDTLKYSCLIWPTSNATNI